MQALTPVDDAQEARAASATVQLEGLLASDYSPHLDVLALGYADGSFEVRCPAPQHVLSRGKHEAMVVNVALSPDGQRLVTADRNGIIALSEVQSGELELLPQAPGADVGLRTPVGLAWDSAGKQLAIGSGQFVRVVRIDTGASQQATLSEGANAVAFSPDGAELAVGGERLTFLSLPELKEKRRFALPREDGRQNAPETLDLRYSRDGRWLGVLLQGGVALIELASGATQKAFASDLGPGGLRFANDGRLALFGRSSLYVGPISASDIQAGTRTTAGKLWDVEFRQDGSLLFLGEDLDADLEANLQ